MEKERKEIKRFSQQITVEVKRISKRACFCLSTQRTVWIVSVTTIFHLSRFILVMTLDSSCTLVESLEFTTIKISYSNIYLLSL